MQGVKRNCVRLLPHDHLWKDEYSTVATLITNIWEDQILSIAHVGSTAIESIMAKPILDIAVKVRDIAKLDITALQNRGYDYRGPQHGDNTYHLFVLRDENDLSLQHIHVYDQNNPQFDLLVGFVSYLNSHPDIAQQYNDLKKSLADRYSNDRPAYTRGKEQFILSIYNQMSK